MDQMTQAAGPAPRYARGAIIIHWATAALMLGQLALGLTLGNGHGAASFARFQLHKSIGITILLLTLARIGWRLAHRPPASEVHGWEARLAAAVHAAFYLLLLAIPLSGWLIVSASPTRIPTLLYGIVPWPAIPVAEADRAGAAAAASAAHMWLAWAAIAAIALHVAGALKHQLVDRDRTFARMVPGAGPGFDPRLALAAAAGVAAVAAGLFVRPAAPGRPAPATAAKAVAAAPAQVATLVPALAPISVASPTAQAKLPASVAAPAAAATVEPARWRVLPGGTLGFATRWSGNALSGRFTDWSAQIRFDEAALDRSQVTATIRTGSARTGEEQPDGALPGGDWFASDAFPTATFTARGFRRAGAGRYVADGTLTVRGRSRPLRLPFTLAIAGDTATMTGHATIDRLAFGVGFPSTDDIPAEVGVTIALRARRQE